MKLAPEELDHAELRSILRRDVSECLSEQEALAREAGREPLSDALRRFRAAIQ